MELMKEAMLFCVILASICISSTWSSSTTAAKNPVMEDVKVINVHEDQILRKSLATIKCADTTAPNQKCPECNVISWRPPAGTNTFDVWKEGTSTDFQLFFVAGTAGKDLNYEYIRSYFVDVRCHAYDKVSYDIKTVEIDVHPNQPPTITGWPLIKNVQIDAKNPSFNPIGTKVIYHIDAKDPEDNPLTYTMYTDVHDVDFFSITADGDIVVTKDLMTATMETIPLKVSVSDGRSTVGPLIVNVKLTNLNKRPLITPVPQTVTLSENTANGTLVSTLSFSDDIALTEPVNHQCTVIPNSKHFQFRYISSYKKMEIRLANTLDAETNNYYNISCVINDGYLDSVGGYVNVYVVNKNEPPKFNEKLYSCSMYESKPHVSNCDMGMVITDPENDPITRVYLTNENTNLFRFDEDTRKMYFNVDYDIDVGGNTQYPRFKTLTIEAVDNKGATSTAKINVNIADCTEGQTCFICPNCDSDSD